MLELVDYEFMALRDELLEYQTAADKEARSPAPTIALDQATLAAVFKVPTSFCNVLDLAVTGAIDIKLQKNMPDPSSVSQRVQQMHDVGILDMSPLQEAVTSWQPHVLDFSGRWVKRPDSMRTVKLGSQRRLQLLQRGLPRGVGLFYMWLVMKAESVVNGDGEAPKLRDWDAVTEIWAETVNALGSAPSLPPRRSLSER